MSEITDADAEWAVVDRLGKMLENSHHDTYNVTQAYGLFVAVLAWVMERIRTKGEGANDNAAKQVRRNLEGQKVEDSPWSLRTNTPYQADFQTIAVFDFLEWLRDASCHGDARKVSPKNCGEQLIGFVFRMGADPKSKKTQTRDRDRSITLTGRDLRRIGSKLARMYCEAMASVGACDTESAQGILENSAGSA